MVITMRELQCEVHTYIATYAGAAEPMAQMWGIRASVRQRVAVDRRVRRAYVGQAWRGVP